MSAAVSAFLAVLSLAVSPIPQNGTFDSPEAAQADPDFAIQGEYSKDGGGVQVVAQGEGDFLIAIYTGGLPGAGWNGRDRQTVEADANDVADLTEGYQKVERKSPTLAIAPPADAVVLFDGTPESVSAHWKKGARITDDGLLMQGATSKDLFQDFRIHVEFRTPYQPRARGQGRGNSGLYYQGRYETQVLDSFGLEGKDNETGGIYSIRKPDLNMCFPPLTWQTYDGEFRAARYENGKKVSNAVLTVRLNGITVQRGVELPQKTTAAPVNEGPEAGPIYLQDHGNPVRFRNVWVQPIDADKEARRPLVPGFERFHANEQTASVDGGRLLLGDLNCLSCHAATYSLKSQVLTKTAPILTNVGGRLRPEHIWEFLQDPHTVKPGTTMPALLSYLTETERIEAADALTSFLTTTGNTRSQKPNKAWAKSGGRLFHEVGCIACHSPRNGKAANPATSVPMANLGQKYTISGLAAFLKDPHEVRPSGRMPGFEFSDDHARDLAHYLVGDINVQPEQPNVRYSVFYQGFEKVPDLGELKPDDTGEQAGLDIYIAGRGDGFSIRFESLIKITDAGAYKFHLGSDDGSMLYVDGKKTVDVDGVHPHETKTGGINLTEGVHKLVVDYSEVGGQESLSLEIEGPGISRQPIDGWLTLNEDGSPPQAIVTIPDKELTRPTFTYNADLVAKGARLFASLGCASCHDLATDGKPIPSLLQVPELAACDSTAGCMASTPSTKVPNYDLNDRQRSAITAAMSAEVADVTAEQSIGRTMTAFNCYACHERGSIGGPEPDRHAMFVSRIPEMGDEGRIPPPLNGVGDKLKESWLKHVLQNGAKDRPYMLTRMPKFGAQVATLADAFVKVDRQAGGELAEVVEPAHRLISNGRKLVGSEGLSCIKCHTFGKYKATGIQAIDLQTMANRINEDWFHKYLPKPEALRPGTRMPTAFPNGKSVVPEIYGGDPGKQMAAIWEYLEQGDKAKVPVGVMGGLIELKPAEKPIIYRNFIAGLSPRGIAVGYPENANLAWDANSMALALIWHGRFIDASMHWQGRGQGRQQPLGDNSITFETTVAVAALDSRNAAWPTENPRDNGYRFLGYQLGPKGRPTFRYETETFEIRDTPIPIVGKSFASLERHIEVIAPAAEQLYFRAAVGGSIATAEDGWFVVDCAVRVRVRNADSGFLRQSDGRSELLIPITPDNGRIELIQDIAW